MILSVALSLRLNKQSVISLFVTYHVMMFFLFVFVYLTFSIKWLLLFEILNKGKNETRLKNEKMKSHSLLSFTINEKKNVYTLGNMRIFRSYLIFLLLHVLRWIEQCILFMQQYTFISEYSFHLLSSMLSSCLFVRSTSSVHLTRLCCLVGILLILCRSSSRSV